MGIGFFTAAAAIAMAAGAQPGPSNPGSLLIVAPHALAGSLQEFLAFKRGRLPTQIAELEAVLSTTHGADDPERLKRFVFDRWTAGRAGGSPLKYLLLIGDADIMPVRYMVLDRNTDAAFNYAFYPSDLYYADLAKPDGSFENWNATTGAGPDGKTPAAEAFHAAYFGEVRGEHFKSDPMNFDHIDYKPEIGVGRWPVSTPEEAAIVAAKTMTYESAVESNDPKARQLPARAALIASGGWIENRPAMDGVAAKLGSR